MDAAAEILIVDDSPDDIELTRAVLLDSCNARVTGAQTAEDALDFLYRRGSHAARASGLPKLILLDLNMPETDGLELLGIIKSDEALRRIPVVMLTSSAEEESMVACYDRGSNAYIVKPTAAADLAAALRKTEAFWLTVNAAPPQG